MTVETFQKRNFLHRRGQRSYSRTITTPRLKITGVFPYKNQPIP
nr:MAG TPA: hypothetical protein [Bacteriophage sp.]